MPRRKPFSVVGMFLDDISNFFNWLYSKQDDARMRSAEASAVAKLEAMIAEEPYDIESRKSDFAIQLNISSQIFESAWHSVALKNPDLFPAFTKDWQKQLFHDAINFLASTPSRIITRQKVIEHSGLPHEVVEKLWFTIAGHHYYSAYIESKAPPSTSATPKSTTPKDDPWKRH